VFLLFDGREAFYGGAAGGGKSAALLMAALQYVDVPGYHALILRRTFAQLSKGEALIPLSQEWLAGTDAVWNEQRKAWRFPSGATVEFGHVENEADRFDFQGAAFQLIAFDELTQFSEEVYDFIAFSRARRRRKMVDEGVPIRVRSTANPGGVGHAWVRKRFIDRRKRGVLFVPAKVADNPGLDVPSYVQSLSHLPEALRQQLLEGRWDVFEAMAFPLFDPALHVVSGFPLEQFAQRTEGMDYGLNAPTAWYLAATDYDGNVIIGDSYYQPGLPSETAAAILAKRSADWGDGNLCFADPTIQHRTGGWTRRGVPATVALEFSEAGVNLVFGNNDPRAGYARLSELIKPDQGHRFPDWHPRRGEHGSPRLFIVGPRCSELVEQLQAAPLQPLDKRDGGEMISPEWEGRYGHATAAARYLVMGRPRPSEEPPEPEPTDPAKFRTYRLKELMLRQEEELDDRVESGRCEYEWS
jgi:Terminase large subunit, T4likevirus-type, N-terminal